MKVQTGYLYHIKDEFFDKIKSDHSRPSYLAIEDNEILWLVQDYINQKDSRREQVMY